MCFELEGFPHQLLKELILKTILKKDFQTKKGRSHIAKLDGLRDRRQAHGAGGVGTLADLGGAIETEEVVAAGNQRGDHLALHAVDAHLLAPGGPVAEG